MITVIVAVSFFIFSNDSNDFSTITEIEYQKYNHSEDKYGEIEDDETISQLTGLFNKANHQNIVYNKAYHNDYKLTLLYEDETSETVRIWKGFGKDYDLLNYSYVPIKVKGMNGSTQMISCIGQENKEDIMIKFHDIFDIIIL
ncbi:hypothetical protein SAMN05421758_11528 [Salimicrobium salexigens]|uniref:Lipoprotein n=1 Tax=Salimicrobium salexigens TaxID=908941 RepID=A0ABY1KZL6_9BACI|nr:hypothetical protein SAMN05421758_11528 [Salimicrobium salexigens]